MADEEYRKEDACTDQEADQTAAECGQEETAAGEEHGSCGACAEETPKEPAQEDGDAGTEQAEKKGFFSRGKKADKEKAEMKEKIDALEDRVRRQMAEFDNFRKRTDKEKDQMFSMGEKNVIEKILPIVDNFERGFDSVDEADKEDAFVAGMEKIYTQLTKQLEAFGVTPIEAVGKEFNPELHNAVMQVETEEYESGVVAQELQKGYMYRDQVLRHSMVAVAQ